MQFKSNLVQFEPISNQTELFQNKFNWVWTGFKSNWTVLKPIQFEPVNWIC